jgi:hypothetical protein
LLSAQKYWLSCAGNKQFTEHNTCRGFQSSQEPVNHFGLGSAGLIDTVKVVWLNGSEQLLTNVKPNQVITLQYENGSKQVDSAVHQQRQPLFADITSTTGISFTHYQNPFEDFNHEPLLPHRFSVNGPFIAAGDVDNNGLEDFWLGGTGKGSGQTFFTTGSGLFYQQKYAGLWLRRYGRCFFRCRWRQRPGSICSQWW